MLEEKIDILIAETRKTNALLENLDLSQMVQIDLPLDEPEQPEQPVIVEKASDTVEKIKFSMQDITEVLTTLTKSGRKNEAIELLTRHDAKTVGTLAEEHYRAVYNEATQLLEAA